MTESRTNFFSSVIYKIFCSETCEKSYIGETGRGLKTRLTEHKRDVRNHNRSNAIVLHIENCGSLPFWPRAEVIEEGMSKSTRKALEAAHIQLKNTMKERPGFFTWSKAGATIALKRKTTYRLRMTIDTSRLIIICNYERARSTSEFSVAYWKNLSMSGPARHGPTRPDPTPRRSLRAYISATAGPIDERSSLVGSPIPSTP